MSVQDNKFPIILGAVTAVAVGGLVWWGMKSKGAYGQAKSDYDSASSELSRLTRSKPYPNQANQTEKAGNVADYATQVGELLAAFDPYRQTELQNVPVGEFTDNLRAAREEAIAAFEKANPEIEIPEGFYVGLRQFTDRPPSQNVTGVLSYELNAIKKLLLLLAEAKPTKLNNIHRPDLPEESGQTVNLDGKAYRSYPVEITFTGREETLREFISSLDNQKEYYYVIRSLRLRNERQTPPNAGDARFEQPKPEPAAADPFAGGGFVFPDQDGGDAEEPAEEPAAETPAEETPAGPTDSGEILKRVLGDEKVNVFLHIDILQFLGAQELPEA
jgi:hypothetical protein